MGAISITWCLGFFPRETKKISMPTKCPSDYQLDKTMGKKNTEKRNNIGGSLVVLLPVQHCFHVFF